MDPTWVLTGQLSDGGRVRSIALRMMPFRVGRRSDLSLCLPHPTVSNLHAEFIGTGNTLFLYDLQSTNGTYVNGQRVVGRVEVRHDDLVQFADKPFRVRLQSRASESRTMHEDVCDRALAMVQFDKLFTERAILPYFQPVVDLRDGQTIGYEILSRSRLVGLETPEGMFRAAAQLDVEAELSRIMRVEGVRTSACFPEPPHVFVNTHPAEIASGDLLERIAVLRQMTTSQLITVEIHETAVADVAMMKQLRTGLDELNMRLAFDDFGAGQARLLELAEVQPHYLKFDRQMVQDIHQGSAQRQQMLAHFVHLVRDLGVAPLAEGIECQAEADVCQEMGFELAQGFFFGKPAPVAAYLTPQPSLR